MTSFDMSAAVKTVSVPARSFPSVLSMAVPEICDMGHASNKLSCTVKLENEIFEIHALDPRARPLGLSPRPPRFRFRPESDRNVHCVHHSISNFRPEQAQTGPVMTGYPVMAAASTARHSIASPDEIAPPRATSGRETVHGRAFALAHACRQPAHGGLQSRRPCRSHSSASPSAQAEPTSRLLPRTEVPGRCGNDATTRP